MLCPSCKAPIDADAVFCGHCGAPLPPVHLRTSGADEGVQVKQLDHTSDDAINDISEENTYKFSPSPAYPLTPSPVSRPPSPAPSTLSLSQPRPGHTHSTGRNLAFIAVILAILGIAIAAVVFALWQNRHITSTNTTALPQKTTGGLVMFRDNSQAQKGPDSVSLMVNGLDKPTAAQHYAAWLVDENEAHIQPLGTLTQTGNDYELKFTGQDNNLLAMGSIVQVTLETTQAALPTGRVVLRAQFPPLALVHIKHLLVSYPSTPNQTALLTGLLDQTRQVSFQAQLLRSSNNKTVIRCAAQNIMTLVDGHPLAKTLVKPKECAAAHVPQVTSEFGLLGNDNNGYVSTVGAHASLAATQPDSTDTIRTYAKQIIFSSENLKNWFTTLRQDTQEILEHPEDAGTIKKIASLADDALNGVDNNNNGTIEPIQGEAGALQAYNYGQSMATLKLTAAK
ncbi:hypothetical protein KDA_20070 [Dictyobacter alpinus]|uniref:Zinc-ribbon domain-containing protein n=1 Tax=Dictyobacter alpinus TaxID=2014873 RepID=A0A402B5A9_9CHLR|nr:zinc ribbon domain-containing protein [Dictyobacter alpinus]GCE26523.1 hypothetical protein KDA_20070 [Dictyobacter alpinus]